MSLKIIWQKFIKKLKSEFISESKSVAPKIRVAPTLEHVVKKRIRIAKAKTKTTKVKRK